MQRTTSHRIQDCGVLAWTNTFSVQAKRIWIRTVCGRVAVLGASAGVARADTLIQEAVCPECAVCAVVARLADVIAIQAHRRALTLAVSGDLLCGNLSSLSRDACRCYPYTLIPGGIWVIVITSGLDALCPD